MESPASPPQRNVALAILVAINVLNFYDRHVIGALVEPIRREFHLDDTQIGLLGSVFIWLYAVIGVPLGNMADRFSRKKLLAGGILVWTALTGIAALASTYTILLFSRLGFAAGEAVVAPTATSWIGDLFPADRRARPLALFMIGVPVGGALSYFFSGPVAQAFGWRAAMVLAAVPAVLVLPLLLRLREPQRGASEGAREVQIKGMRAILTVSRIPTMWWIIASGALLNFNMYALGTFLPALLSRVHHVSVAQAGIDTGITYAIGGISGSLFSGWWGDRILKTRQNGRLMWAGWISFASAPAFYFAMVAGSTPAAVAWMTIAYGALCAYYGLVYSSIHDVVAPSMRATAMAVYFMAMYLLGASFGPLITGKISDMMARRAAGLAGSAVITDAFRAIGLQQAMLVMPLLSGLLALVLWMGARTIVDDMNRRHILAAQAVAARAAG